MDSGRTAHLTLANVQLQLDIRRNQVVESKRRPFQMHVDRSLVAKSFVCALRQGALCGQLLYLVGSSLSHSTSPQDAVFQPRAPLASMLPKLYSVQLSCETKRMTQQHV